MTKPTKTPGSLFRAALLVGLGLAALGVARSAQASSTYPPALADAIAGDPTHFPNAVTCVPQCTACHLTTVGGPGMMNKFGLTLEHYGLLPGNHELVAPALTQLTSANDALVAAGMPPIDSDEDGISDIAEIIKGDSPSLAAPDGTGQFCPDIKYGCGAHIAAAPPVDRLGLFSAGLVVLSFAIVRRRRRSAGPRRARK
jgi:hypothetical protein